MDMLRNAADQIAQGRTDVVLKKIRNDEFGETHFPKRLRCY